MKTKSKAAAAKAVKTTAKDGRQTVKKSAPGGTITLIAKSCPSKSGTVRAKRWAKLKSGMSVGEANDAGVPSIYLKRMVAAGHVKID
jgi:hypothetical protein